MCLDTILHYYFALGDNSIMMIWEFAHALLPFKLSICSFLAWIGAIACTNLYWELESSRWISYLQGNTTNTILKPLCFSVIWSLSRLPCFCHWRELWGVWNNRQDHRIKGVRGSSGNHPVQSHFAMISKGPRICMGLKDSHSFLTKLSQCQFRAALLNKLISPSVA